MYFGIRESLLRMRNRAAMDHAIAWKYGIGPIGCLPLEPRIKRAERLLRFGKHLLETVDDEIGFLIRVDAEFGIEHAFEIEADAVRSVAIKRMEGLALGR